jgi:hypothetical protein
MLLSTDSQVRSPARRRGSGFRMAMTGSDGPLLQRTTRSRLIAFAVTLGVILSAVAATVFLALAAGPAAWGAAGPSVWVPTFPGGRPVAQHPTQIGLSGNGDAVLTHIRWLTWGNASATGTARLTLVESCVPDCASAQRNIFAVRVRATRIQLCEGRRTYTRVTAYFIDSHPQGERSKSAVLC